MVVPFCDGLWLEFGVFRGHTLGLISKWKNQYCGANGSLPVHGFDTFEGLPTNWRPGYPAGAFSAGGPNIAVPENARLVKGLFIDTLPGFLRQMDNTTGSHTPVSFVHVDCDIYEGTRDVFFLLQNRLVKGTIIIFDELFNYPEYEKHEIKALYELLSGARIRLIPLGSSINIDLQVTQDAAPTSQSFGFVVDEVQK